jgi:hypothetical protein
MFADASAWEELRSLFRAGFTDLEGTGHRAHTFEKSTAEEAEIHYQLCDGRLDHRLAVFTASRDTTMNLGLSPNCL